ncbi:MAG: peptidylprolyl isomerase [Candidatus Eisenbacteria bacterium]|nr:peptidylprolyl isomerase [Candidatus Eisenbacteria bacterium]
MSKTALGHRQVTILLSLVCLFAALRPAGAASGRSAPTTTRAGLDETARILRIEDRRESPDLLLPFLSSSRTDVRARACLAMGRIASPPDTFDCARVITHALAQRLREDPAPEVRSAAAFALGLLQSREAGAAAAARIVSGAEANADVRAALVEAVGRCGPDPHPAAIARALSDPEAAVVQAALLACWKGRRAEGLARALELTRSSDPETRWRAAYAITRMLGSPTSGRTPSGGGADLAPGEQGAILERALELARDPDPRVSLPALRALGKAAPGSDLAARATAILRDALHDEDPRKRVEALRSLAALVPPSSACDPDVARMLLDPHPHVRMVAIESAARLLGPQDLQAALAPACASPSAWERAAAVQALVSRCVETDAHAPALRAIADARADTAWVVRDAAAIGLAAYCERRLSSKAHDGGRDLEAGGAQESRDHPRDEYEAQALALVQACLDDDPRVAKEVAPSRVAACLAAEPRFARARAGIEPLLTHADEIVRAVTLEELGKQCAAILAQAGDENDARELLACAVRGASDRSADARQMGIALLVELLPSRVGEDARDALVRVARSDPDRRLRASAIRAVEKHDGGPLTTGRPGCSTCPSTRIEAGPQETHLSAADYRRALDEAARIRQAIVDTEGGALVIALDGEAAPLTTLNFARLAESGALDHGCWHRVVPDFVVQDGCSRGDGWGGPGYSIRCEINALHYAPGVLGMALSGKDTGGSQYFLTLSDQPHLDGRYTIFGRLVEGWETMNALAPGARIERVRIVREAR